MLRLKVALVWVPVLLLLLAPMLLAQPVPVSAAYNENTNTFRIDFDSEIVADQSSFIIGGITIDDGPLDDYELRAGKVLVSDANQVKFRPIFDGIVGEYTYTDDAGGTDFRELWGTDYSDVVAIEEDLNHNDMRLYLPAGTAVSPDGVLSVAAWVPLYYYERGEDKMIEIIDAAYDAGTNVLSLGFNAVMQYDQLPEDIIGEHEQNPAWPGPGDGVITPTREGEDRNENGTIDFEQNVKIAQITISDGLGGSVTLSSALDLTADDADVLELELLPSDRAAVEMLDGESMMISFGSYTFVNVHYNPAEPAENFPVEFTADPFPLEAVSASYDMGLNLFKVTFNQALDTRVSEHAVIPKLVMQRVSDGEEYALEAGTPGLADGDLSLTVILGVSTAHALEDLIDVDIDGDFNVLVRSNAVLSEFGNGNVDGLVVAEIILEGSNKGPELDPDVAPYYNAEINELFMRFDVRLEGDFVFENVHFIAGTDTVTLGEGEASRTGGNKAFSIIVSPEDRYAIENTLDTGDLRLVVDPYTVMQSSKLNGNRAIEVYPLDYFADPNPPLLEYVWYDFLNGRVVVGSNGTVPVDNIDLSKLQVSGVGFSTPDSAVIDGPDRISLYLSEGDVAGMETIDELDRPSLMLTTEAGFLTSGDGVESVELIDIVDGDTLFNDVDEAVLTLGYGREFVVRSREAFPTVPRYTPASLRAVSDNALWYVANDQWVPYQPFELRDAQSVVHPIVNALRAEELEVAIDFFENQTPKLETSGAHDAIVSLVATGREDQLPEKVNILFADIFDEFGLGRNDSKDAFWSHGYFLPSDLPGSEEEDSNQSELIIIDSYPQSFTTGDESFNWDSNNEEWDPVGMEDLDVAGFAALANVYTQYVAYKVDKFEEDWVNLGLAFFSEFYTYGAPQFYGDGAAGAMPGSNSMTFIGNGFKSREDHKYVYMYFLYLWEKYGGDDFITALATSPRTGMSGVADALDVRSEFLEDWQLDIDINDLFLDFATAALLDTSFTEADNNRFMFENLNAQGAIRGTALKWKPTAGKDRPPYSLSCPEWGFSYYFTGYGPFDPNLLLNPTEDNLVVFAGEGADGLQLRKVNMQATTVAGNMSSLPIATQEVALDEELHRAQVPMSPDGAEGDWVFGPTDNPDATFPTWMLVAAGSGDFMVHHESEPADYSSLFVMQNPVVSTAIDLFVISERPLYRADGVAAPTVSVYTDADKSELISQFDSPDDFAQASVENASGSFEQYTAHVTMTDTGEMYWFLEGYYSNGVPVLESDPTMMIMSTFEGGQPGVVKLDDGFQISATAYSFTEDRNLFIMRSPEVAEVSEGTFSNVFEQMKPVSASYSLGGKLEKLNDPIQLTIPFDMDAAEGDDVGLYLLRYGQWDYVGGTVNESDGTINAPVGYLGTYAVLAGPHGEIPAELVIPTSFDLGQNYPNPFNPSTTIRVALPQTSPLTLIVYDVLGREVARLFDGEMPYGMHSFHFDGQSATGSPIASGVYFVRMDAAGFSSTRKMVMVK